MILFSASMLALLTPFTDTIYLPALKNVEEDLDSSEGMVALTVSIYLATVGLGQLIWGPLSDKYGRRLVLILALCIYLAITIACIFSVDVNMFLVLRSFQGLIVGATIIVAQAIIADVFPASERGEAMGTFMAPMLVGPVIAPLIGGILSQTFSWRACFVLLAVITAPIMLLAYIFIPETHHFFVKKLVHREESAKLTMFGKQTVEYELIAIDSQPASQGHSESQPAQGDTKVISEEDPVSQQGIVFTDTTPVDKYDHSEAQRVNTLLLSKQHDYDVLNLTLLEASNIAEPELQWPWETFYIAMDSVLLPFILTAATSFAVMFCSLTVAPLYLIEAPYSLSEGAVGITFLAFGVGCLTGALFGGKICDASIVAFPQAEQGRMVYVLSTTPFIVIGGMMFAYALENEIHLAMVLVAQFFLGFSQSAILTNCMAYLTAVKPMYAAVTCAIMMCLSFCFAAICTASAVPAVESISLVGFFWIICAIYSLCVFWWVYVTYRELRVVKTEKEGLQTSENYAKETTTVVPESV